MLVLNRRDGEAVILRDEHGNHLATIWTYCRGRLTQIVMDPVPSVKVIRAELEEQPNPQEVEQ